MNLILLKDTKTKKTFRFNSVLESNDFVESYDAPNDLIFINELYFDGAGYNGKISEIAFTVGSKIECFSYEKNFTNNTAEYLALLNCVKFANISDNIKGDSLLIINQVLGTWKCNAKHLIPFRDIIRREIEQLNLTLEWIPREFNLAGIHLDKLKKQRRKHK